MMPVTVAGVVLGVAMFTNFGSKVEGVCDGGEEGGREALDVGLQAVSMSAKRIGALEVLPTRKAS